MSKELSGFDKSAPSAHPTTRGQKPVSAWDMDNSPLQALLDQQLIANRQLMEEFSGGLELFSNKMEKALCDLHEVLQAKEKNADASQKQLDENDEIRKLLANIGEGIAELNRTIHELSEQQRQFPEKKFFKELLDNLVDNQNKLLAHVIHYCERIANSLDSFSSCMESLKTIHQSSQDLLKRQQEIFEKESSYKRNENFLFYFFVGILLILLTWFMIGPH